MVLAPDMAVSTQTVLIYAHSPEVVWQHVLEPTEGMTVEQAIESSGFEAQYPDVDWRAGGVGIFGKRVKPDDRLKPGDRLEIYRTLVFDPKESRRRRALHRQRQKLLKGKPRGRQRTV